MFLNLKFLILKIQKVANSTAEVSTNSICV